MQWLCNFWHIDQTGEKSSAKKRTDKLEKRTSYGFGIMARCDSLGLSRKLQTIGQTIRRLDVSEKIFI